jgi:hypothetical protein
VVPVGSPTNVTASIQESTIITNNYSAADLAVPLDGTTTFYTVLVDDTVIQDTEFVLTYGTDTGLKTVPGWDDATGLGTPNGKAFADFFKPAK